MNLLENTFVNFFNRATAPTKKPLTGGLLLGHIVGENGITQQPYYLPTADRAKHIAILGKTGSGKSFLIRHLAQTDIRAGRGFLLFDLHGDLIPDLLRFAASLGIDPARIVLIDPTSREWAIGLNPLEAKDEAERFRQVTGVTRTFTERWNFTGARTEELFRNALLVLSENGLTLLEVALLLTNENHRAVLLKNVTNADVKEYFELRFNPLSDAMKATMREPVINKLTELTADPHFRFILGQRTSTISFDRIMQYGLIALVNLNKGALGPHALTLGSLIYGKAKSAILSDFIQDDDQYKFTSDRRLESIESAMALACNLGNETTVPTSIKVVMGRLRSSDLERLKLKRRLAIDAFWSRLLSPASVEPDGTLALRRFLG